MQDSANPQQQQSLIDQLRGVEPSAVPNEASETRIPNPLSATEPLGGPVDRRSPLESSAWSAIEDDASVARSRGAVEHRLMPHHDEELEFELAKRNEAKRRLAERERAQREETKRQHAKREEARREREAREQDDWDEDEIDYFPMFWASVTAGIVSLSVQILSTIYFALFYGASIEVRTWFKVIPYMAMAISNDGFRLIVMWASLVSAALIGLFSIMAFVRRRRLQVKAGRLFGWINVALIGFLNLVRVTFFDDYAASEPWMWGLILVGLVVFAVGSYIVWVDFDDREESLDR